MTTPPPKDDPAFECWCRDAMVELVQSFVACGYASDPARFVELIAPGEGEAVARSMALNDSTCGLAVRGWLGAGGLGLSDARLRAPYRSGLVMSGLVAMAREAGGIITVAELEPGDILILGAPEHALVVESIDGTALSTIQGGERDVMFHEQEIERIARTLRSVGMRTLVDDRPIEFALSLPALAAKFLP